MTLHMSLTHITYQTHPDITRLTGVMGGGGTVDWKKLNQEQIKSQVCVKNQYFYLGVIF